VVPARPVRRRLGRPAGACHARGAEGRRTSGSRWRR
jgi:hypothetical protein